MDKEMLIIIMTPIGSLALIIRWLLTVHFKNQKQLENLRSSIVVKQISELERVSKDLLARISSAEKSISEAKTEILKAAQGYKDNRESFKDLGEKMGDFVAQTKRSFEHYKTEITQLKKIMIVRGKKL